MTEPAGTFNKTKEPADSQATCSLRTNIKFYRSERFLYVH